MNNLKNISLFLIFTFNITHASANYKIPIFSNLNISEFKDVYDLDDGKVLVSLAKNGTLKVEFFINNKIFELKENLSDIERDVDVNSYSLSRSISNPEKFKLLIPFGNPREVKVAGAKVIERNFIDIRVDLDGRVKKEIFYWPEPQG
ncbi:hypothetical protein [uncultured Microbulbifer sp.]|uniref:hypothetical protein n=1 Tax=uncultured Microbulbifer sp. TaxID=348147 RepID=UPI00260AB21D|nr:hypothetical protein [uncultured Microbulbifer sp.]